MPDYFALAVANARDEFTPVPVDVIDGPHPCCAEFAQVVRCDGSIDLIRCPVCGYQHEAPCAN